MMFLHREYDRRWRENVVIFLEPPAIASAAIADQNGRGGGCGRRVCVCRRGRIEGCVFSGVRVLHLESGPRLHTAE